MEGNEGTLEKLSKNTRVWSRISSKKQQLATGASTRKKAQVITKSRQREPVLALDMFWTRCIMDKLHGIGWRKQEWEPIWRLLIREFILGAFVLWFIVSLGQEIQHDRKLLDRFGNPEMIPDRLFPLPHTK